MKNYTYLVNVNESLSKNNRHASIPSSKQKNLLQGRPNMTVPSGPNLLNPGPEGDFMNSNMNSRASSSASNFSNYNANTAALGYINPVVRKNGVYIGGHKNSRASSVKSDKLLPKGSIPDKYLNAMEKMQSRRGFQ